MESRIRVLETQLNEAYDKKKALEAKTTKMMRESDENTVIIKEILESEYKGLNRKRT
jgi:uncharacterized protein YigA (DUF484 family)